MLKRLSLLPLLALATACASVPGATVDPAARRGMMQALPDQGSCRPGEPQGARNCTMRLGTKEVRVFQWQNLTTIRYNAADTAEPAFVAGMRRVLTTAGTPNLDRAMTLITSHGRSGAMENFTTGCFPNDATPPVNACFVSLTY